MAKWVRLQNNIVAEVIPLTSMEDIIKYYGNGQETDFTRACIEAPNEVEQDWVYDPETQTFLASPPIDITTLRTTKKQELGTACTQAIYAGVEVEGRNYALTEHDQTEMMAQLSTVQAGAPAVPYHADGELCRMYPAAEFVGIANKAMAYIFYHRTYCNHLNAWVARAEAAELDSIYYGAMLPDDLAQHMAALLAEAGGGQT